MAADAKPMPYLITPGGKIAVPPWHPAYRRKPSMSLPGKLADRIRFDPLA